MYLLNTLFWGGPPTDDQSIRRPAAVEPLWLPNPLVVAVSSGRSEVVASSARATRSHEVRERAADALHLSRVPRRSPPIRGRLQSGEQIMPFDDLRASPSTSGQYTRDITFAPSTSVVSCSGESRESEDTVISSPLPSAAPRVAGDPQRERADVGPLGISWMCHI